MASRRKWVSGFGIIAVVAVLAGLATSGAGAQQQFKRLFAGQQIRLAAHLAILDRPNAPSFFVRVGYHSYFSIYTSYAVPHSTAF